MSLQKSWTRTLILCLALSLSACGGGGGGGSADGGPSPGGSGGPSTTTPPPSDTGGTGTTPPPSDTGGTGTTPPPNDTGGTGTTPPPEGSGGTPPGDGSGGGSGGGTTPPPAGLSLSSATLTFNAASPNSAVPDDQIVTATYSGNETGTVRIVALSNGGTPLNSPIDSMTVFAMNGRTGQATVRASGPDLLGPGSYSDTVIIKACIDSNFICSYNELPGSPQTLTVNYVIGPAPTPPDAVMPRVATAGTSARVILRGTALSGTTSVRFGPHEATDVAVVSDTEVHATYPVLAAGTYVIALNSGAIPFTGSIVAVPPTNYSNDSIVLPEQPARLSFLRYDAERGALLAGGFYFRSANITNKLWRYTHDGLGWSAAQTVDVAGLNDAVLAADGSHLLAVADAGVVELSTADFSILRTTPGPGPGGTGNGSLQLYGIAIANNGMALIRGGTEGVTGPNPMYYFSTQQRSFRAIRTGLFNGDFSRGLLGSDDGSRILGSVSGILPAQPLLRYDASTTLRTHRLASDGGFPTMAARDATKVVVYPLGEGYPLHHRVHSAHDDTLLGVLPGPVDHDDTTLRIRLVVLNPQGTRAYVLRADNTLHTHALDQPTVDGAFVEVGSPVTITLPTQQSQALIATTTPDGRTLFIGGNRGVLVIPTSD
jgi:hypothetical protein